MAGSTFVYDESGTTFLYFLLSFEALVVIPCTYYFYPRSSSRQEKDKTICHCYGCNVKNTRLISKEPLRKAKERFIKFCLLLGWVILFMTAYKVAHIKHDYVAYDPFEILEIEPEASMAEIKKAYRRLSLVYHPDKETGDEVMFMRIAKAYAALTDEQSRTNWELFGNPDGPGPTTFGIALPSYIVQKENSVLVLGLYALIFMVALPVGVTIWWYRSIRFAGEEVLLDTSHLYYYFIYKTPLMVFKRVIMIIAASREFERSHNTEIVERESDNYEVPQLIKELSNLGEKNKEKPLCFSYSIKARALIYAHLSRLKLSKSLESDKLVVIRKCPYLLQEFVSCTASLTMLSLAGRISRMPKLSTMENAMKLSPCIIQGLWDNKSPLLQLPHLNEDMLRHFTSRKRSIRSIFQLAFMPEEERRGLLRTLSDDEYLNVMNVISKLPSVDLQVRSEVLDDDEDSFIITAGAIVTVTVNLIRRNLGDVVKENMKTEVESTACADEEHSEQANVANGDISTKAKKVWEKPSKKKRGKKQPKKKVTANSSVKASANKKVLTSSENLPNGINENSKGEEKTKDKKENVCNTKDSADSESDDSSSAEGGAEENLDNTKDKQDIDDDENDDEWEKFQQKVMRKKEKNPKSKESHVVHCPYFPDLKYEGWWVYLTDKNKSSLVTNPFFVTNLVQKEEVEMKFTAPSKPGIYSYSVIVRSDSYLDFDVIKTIQLDVKEAKEVDITKVQWDVSEEEEEKDEEESAVEDSDLASDEVDDD